MKELQVGSTATEAEMRAPAPAQPKAGERFERLLAALVLQRTDGKPRKR